LLKQLESLELDAAKASLEYYSEYLGYVNAPFHARWYELLQPLNDSHHFSPLREHPDALKRWHEEAPRKHAKSECMAINYPSWLIGNFRDIHILIISESGTLAYKTSAAIKRRFEGAGETGRRHVEIFGDMRPAKGIQWSDNRWTVKRDSDSKFPTVEATGLLGSFTGGGYDLIIVDDLISAKWVQTKGMREKTRQWLFEVVMTTMFPWSAMLVMGTRWHYDDIYAQLLQTWPHEVLKAITNEREITRGAAPQVLWPAMWPYPRLINLRDGPEGIGTLWFNCQYQNDPSSLEGEVLKAEWLHEYETLPSGLTYYAGVDPAPGEGDMMAISVYAFDSKTRQLYLVEVWCERVSFSAFLKELGNKHTVYHFAKIFVESNAMQKIIVKYKFPELQGLPLVEVNTTQNKEQRFIPMSSHFETSRVLVNQILKSPTSKFYQQWVEFPRGANDDALDAAELPVAKLLSKQPKRVGFAIV
jgi:predicted phage terminase large subunit-like protein